MGCQTTLVNKEVVEHSDVIFIAVKPHLVIQVAQEIESSVDPSKHLIVSIAIAITTDVIEAVSNFSTVSLCQHRKFMSGYANTGKTFSIAFIKYLSQEKKQNSLV